MDNPAKFVPLHLTKLPGHTEEAKPQEAEQSEDLEERVIAALKTCYDPELPVNIVELGLIYELRVEPSGEVHVRMTLTSPGCPVADSLVREVQAKVQTVSGVSAVRVELVWDPPWDRNRLSAAAQLELGLF